MFDESVFDLQDIENIARAIGDSLTKWEIRRKLEEIGLPSPDDNQTKWVYLYDILTNEQLQTHSGEHILKFIRAVMRPAAFASAPERWDSLCTSLNRALAFAGYSVTPAGSVVEVVPAQTLADAAQRANRLHDELKKRGLHDDVLKACRSELLADDYFHAVLETMKGVAEKIRQKSGLTADGSDLCDKALGGSEPILIINELKSSTDSSEHSGFLNLLKGAFGMFRNPTAHAPRDLWPLGEQDAIDLMTLASLFHRRLDQSRINSDHRRKRT